MSSSSNTASRSMLSPLMRKMVVSLLLLSFLISCDNCVNAQEDNDANDSTTDSTGSNQQQQCLDETVPLLEEPNLAISQRIIFDDYKASYDDKCDIGLDKQECSIKFEGDVRTYKALCEQQQNGQLYERPIKLSCGFGTIEYDLGAIPTCVGKSCNITNGDIGPENVQTEQVDAFLNNLTFTGCKAVDVDGAYGNTFGGARPWLLLLSVGLVLFV